MTDSRERRTFGSGEPSRLRKVGEGADVLLAIDDHEATLQQTEQLAGYLDCDLIEVRDAGALASIMALRRPSVALLALDARSIAAVSALRILSTATPPVPVVLIGEVDPGLLASTRRLARAQGITVAGTLKRPIDASAAEQLCNPFLGAPPAIPRADLERALREHEFSLVYQPRMIIGPEQLRMVGVEAFVRWQHPRRGLLRPGQFLGSLEREQLLVDLMDFVMEEAIRQAGQWRGRGLELQVGINLSPRLVRDHAIPDRLAALLSEHGVPPESIVIDVTEDTEDRRALVLDVFTALRLMGVGLALDNFGTGCSSLTELCRMPFTEVKIDGSLIDEIPQEREASIIVRGIVELAHTLGMSVCAEGVERQEAVGYLRQLGCDALQGSVVSLPLDAAEIERRAQSFNYVRPAQHQVDFAHTVLAVHGRRGLHVAR